VVALGTESARPGKVHRNYIQEDVGRAPVLSTTHLFFSRDFCLLYCSPVLQITYMISRKRSEFGAPIKFSDQNASSVKDAYIECTAYSDKNFTLKQLERDVGMQVVPQIKETSTQTRW